MLIKIIGIICDLWMILINIFSYICIVRPPQPAVARHRQNGQQHSKPEYETYSQSLKMGCQEILLKKGTSASVTESALTREGLSDLKRMSGSTDITRYKSKIEDQSQQVFKKTSDDQNHKIR